MSETLILNKEIKRLINFLRLSTRPYLIIFVISIFVATLSIFLCISLLISNSELKENDIKFRMVRLRKPSWSNQIDTDYFKNSDSLERLVKFEEVKIIAAEKAKKKVQNF